MQYAPAPRDVAYGDPALRKRGVGQVERWVRDVRKGNPP